MSATVTEKLKTFFKGRVSHYHVEMVFLCGSFAGGYPRIESDIDLGILFSSKLHDPSELHKVITEISYTLTLNLHKEVDIFAISRDFSHPMLYYNAIVLGVPIFISDNDAFLRLKLDAIHQMEDFSLFGVHWQRRIAENVLMEKIHD